MYRFPRVLLLSFVVSGYRTILQYMHLHQDYGRFITCRRSCMCSLVFISAKRLHMCSIMSLLTKAMDSSIL